MASGKKLDQFEIGYLFGVYVGGATVEAGGARAYTIGDRMNFAKQVSNMGYELDSVILDKILHKLVNRGFVVIDTRSVGN